MRAFLVLLAAVLNAASAAACQCWPVVQSLPDNEAGQAQLAAHAKGAFLATDEVLRVRVLSRGELGNARTYVVQVQEHLKSLRASDSVRVLATGPDSCQLELTPNEEWLVLVNAGRVSQCGGHALLGSAREWPELSAVEAANLRDFHYKFGARWLKAIRTVAAAATSQELVDEPRRPSRDLTQPLALALALRIPDAAAHEKWRSVGLNTIQDAIVRTEARIEDLQLGRDQRKCNADANGSRTIAQERKPQIYDCEAGLSKLTELLVQLREEKQRTSRRYDAELAQLKVVWACMRRLPLKSCLEQKLAR